MSSPTVLVRGYLERRTVATPAGTIDCHRPHFRLDLLVRGSGRVEVLELVDFILDTGSDVSLVPIRFARRYRLLGFDEAAVWVSTRTSFQGELNGRWGTLQLRLAADTRVIPCFYYDPSASQPSRVARWFDRWVRRSARPMEEPRVLGCAGILGGNLRLVLDGNREVSLSLRG